MPIETIALPKRTRESSIKVAPEALQEVHDALDSLPAGEAVIIAREQDGKPFDTEAKARNYARIFANEYQTAYGKGNESRLLSTHSVVGDRYKSGQNSGKPKTWIAAVSPNTRKPVTQRPEGAPTLSELYDKVRQWRKDNPEHKDTFKQYSKWDYETLWATVVEVIDGVPDDDTNTDTDTDTGTDADTDTETVNVDTEPAVA
jgi:hypothetical protein